MRGFWGFTAVLVALALEVVHADVVEWRLIGVFVRFDVVDGSEVSHGQCAAVWQARAQNDLV